MKPPEKTAGPIVFVVDDDASLRGALSSLIRSIGLRVEAFASAREFLARIAHPVEGEYERMAGRQSLRRQSAGSARVPRARRAPAGVERTGPPARAG